MLFWSLTSCQQRDTLVEEAQGEVRETPNFLSLEIARAYLSMAFPGGSVVKNPPANAGDAGNAGSIPRSRRSPEGEMATHSSILALKTPWTEEPDRLQPIGLQRAGHDWARMYYLSMP